MYGAVLLDEPSDLGDRRARPDPDRHGARLRPAPAGAAAGPGFAVTESSGDASASAGRPDDVDFLPARGHDDVEPFLPRARARPRGVRDEIERSLPSRRDRPVRDRGRRGRRVETGGLDGIRRREQAQPDREPRRPRIHPDFRGRRLADDAARVFQRHLLFDLGFHRLQLEFYGFNERAIVMRSARASCAKESSGRPTAPRRVGRRRALRARPRGPGGEAEPAPQRGVEADVA